MPRFAWPGIQRQVLLLLTFQAIFQAHIPWHTGITSAHAARTVPADRAVIQPGSKSQRATGSSFTDGLLSPLSYPLKLEAGTTTSSKQPQLDDIVTVFNPDAAQAIPRLAEAEPLGRLDEDDYAESAQFDLAKAKRMGHLTTVAYCSDISVISSWNCTRCNRAPNFKPYEVVYDTVWDLLGYVGYDEQTDAVTVVFRGTDSSNWGNWINNMKAWRQNKMYPIPGAPRAMVHSGFFDLWTKSSLETNITRAVSEVLALHPTPRLALAGHSMGGALSNLCALDLKFKLNFTDVRVWTFGSPRVGNYAWQELYSEHVAESWRFTHNRDVVPSLPPQLIGFRHVAREAWLVDMAGPSGLIEQKVLLCDSSGEDPSCHNSACMLGLCTSVADHLTYLGLEMYRDPLEC